MLPFWSRATLARFLPSFEGVTVAWGMDYTWCEQLLRDPARPLVAVVDAVQAHHTKPIGDKNTLYKRTGGMQKAREKMEAMLMKAWGLPRDAMNEARLGLSRGTNPPQSTLVIREAKAANVLLHMCDGALGGGAGGAPLAVGLCAAATQSLRNLVTLRTAVYIAARAAVLAAAQKSG
jgi:hypothetical protein